MLFVELRCTQFWLLPTAVVCQLSLAFLAAKAHGGLRTYHHDVSVCMVKFLHQSHTQNQCTLNYPNTPQEWYHLIENLIFFY